MKAYSFCSYVEARSLIEQGELLIYPTETYYALGTSIHSPHKERIYTIKARPLHKAFPIIVHSIEQASQIAILSSQAKELMTLFPKLTIIVPTNTTYTDTETIALRRASTPLLHYLTQDNPIIATSANRSNEPPVSCHINLDKKIRQEIPLCLPMCKEDTPQGKLPSTIISLSQNIITIIRHGNITAQELSSFYPVKG